MFAGRYYCYKLLYYERYTDVQHAIEREKELKLMGREDKLQLIKKENPALMFLDVWNSKAYCFFPTRSFLDDKESCWNTFKL